MSRFFFSLGADHLTFEGGGGGGWVIYGQQDFFSSNLVGRIFSYSSARICFYYICAACNFFLPTSACRKFFFKITHPLPQELNGRPLRGLCRMSGEQINKREDKARCEIDEILSRNENNDEREVNTNSKVCYFL